MEKKTIVCKNNTTFIEKVSYKTFNRLKELQTLLKKEAALKELCKL